MAEVLVLVDHVDGQVKKVTLELLTAARRIGEPSAVVVGEATDELKAKLGEYGAEKIYTAPAEIDDYVVAPKAELLAKLAADKSAAAVLVSVWVQVEVARSICRRDNRPFSWLWMISLPGQWRTMSNFYFEARMLGIWRKWLGAMAVAVLALGILVGLVFIFGEIVE